MQPGNDPLALLAIAMGTATGIFVRERPPTSPTPPRCGCCCFLRRSARLCCSCTRGAGCLRGGDPHACRRGQPARQIQRSTVTGRRRPDRWVQHRAARSPGTRHFDCRPDPWRGRSLRGARRYQTRLNKIAALLDHTPATLVAARSCAGTATYTSSSWRWTCWLWSGWRSTSAPTPSPVARTEPAHGRAGTSGKTSALDGLVRRISSSGSRRPSSLPGRGQGGAPYRTSLNGDRQASAWAPRGLGSVDAAGSRGALTWLDLHNQAGGHVQASWPPLTLGSHANGPRARRPRDYEIKMGDPTSCPDGLLAAEVPLGISHHSPAGSEPLADQMRTAHLSGSRTSAWST